jgi:hypothetical protein
LTAVSAKTFKVSIFPIAGIPEWQNSEDPVTQPQIAIVFSHVEVVIVRKLLFG